MSEQAKKAAIKAWKAATESDGIIPLNSHSYCKDFVSGFTCGVSWALQSHPDVKAVRDASRKMTTFIDNEIMWIPPAKRDEFRSNREMLSLAVARFEKGQADE